MIRKKIQTLVVLLLFVICITSCRKDDDVIPATIGKVTEGVKDSKIKGFYLLNEGNMGSNKATIDYFSYESGVYSKNIFAERNPNVVKELGDVGNDIEIYGSKIYAVINVSHFVEVLDLKSAKHITQITIPNCRYITFKGAYAYVSSYAGPVQIDPNARLGYVAKIDTATLKVVATCVVGYQPEEMAIVGNKLYVANSGGYRVPSYDNTVSVIDLDSFSEIKKITVAINLHRLETDRYGYIYVSSRGDYYKIPSKTLIINTRDDSVLDVLGDLPNSNMTLCGDSLYVYSTEWSYLTNSNKITYAIVNTKTQKVVTRNFIKDGTENQIKIPYGIAVNPETHEFFVTDAGNYVTPGRLYCYSKDGIKKWDVETGDIPAHFAFTSISLE